jgi:hypothetical protein
MDNTLIRFMYPITSRFQLQYMSNEVVIPRFFQEDVVIILKSLLDFNLGNDPF